MTLCIISQPLLLYLCPQLVNEGIKYRMHVQNTASFLIQMFATFLFYITLIVELYLKHQAGSVNTQDFTISC